MRTPAGDARSLVRLAARYADPHEVGRAIAAGLAHAPAEEVVEVVPELYEEQVRAVLDETTLPQWAAFAAEIEESVDVAEIVRTASREDGAALAHAIAGNDSMALLETVARAVTRAYARGAVEHVARELLRRIARD